MQLARSCCVVVLALELAACGDGETHSFGDGAGGGGSTWLTSGTGTGGDLGLSTGAGSLANGSGSAGTGANDGCGSVLHGIVRDFKAEHPDFEGALGDDRGIVAPDLGSDGLPVYAGNPSTPTTNGKDAFDQWYRDVAGVNVAIPFAITLSGNAGISTFSNSAFFPIDDQGFGNEGNPHNYHFTYEIHTVFTYEGGEVFTFTGDDDLFTFINGKLGIDLGGVHGAENQTIDLDSRAAELGITKGNVYALDFFFAERHTVESNFRIDTTIGCFTNVVPPS